MNLSQLIQGSKEGIFLFWGIVIFLIFRLLHFVIARFYKKDHQLLTKTIYFIECFVWYLFLLKGIKQFIGRNIVFSVVITLVLIFVSALLSWFVLKDYFAGLFLKIEGKFKVNDVIIIDGFEGKITKIGSRMAELELPSSQILNIPFHQFFTKRVIRTGTTGKCVKEIFEIRLNRKFEINEALQLIKNYIYQLPWTSATHEQEVFLENFDEKGARIKIIASIFDAKYSYDFRSLIKKRFE